MIDKPKVTSPQPEPKASEKPMDTPKSTKQKGQFKYGEALQKSFLFFEANRSGDLPKDNRVKWRGDSALKDGSDVGRDLRGGYYDAGDHVKFGLPMSANNTMLAWGGIEYKQAYKQSGQWDELLDAVKWGTDYFLKAHVTQGGKTKKLYVQVGDGNADHAYWGPPEKMTMKRPAFKIDRNKPGSDVAAGTASALASASMLFRGVNNSYANKLLKNAKQLFEFADKYRGKYSDSVPQANPFYTSFSGYADELAEGAAWLYKATGQQKYLKRAEQIFDNEIGYPADWSWMADNKSNAANLLLAQESKNPKYKDMFEGWAKNWINGTGNVKYSPGGLAWRTRWGSLALSSATSYLVGLYNDTVKSNKSYRDFAKDQIDYILGDNPRNASYMIGFGKNYPKEPHHRASAGDAPYGKPNEHLLYGAMVGGPGSTNDFDYNDDRNDWITNEVGTGYNAPLTSALIQAYDDFGGDPLSNKELDNLVGIDVYGV
ncbi:glycoside hydrolase family 9 protein [Myxosarcina sp. GI1]|uniref:glycoside hydrolase family 9 protein n=1 Tax=Myxosarcina sp. GI1 TaxID=1541065 RepID=UPI000ADB0027|nr:glycoside hydrolase family 9 protein [Myxosarcina sp. GI1]